MITWRATETIQVELPMWLSLVLAAAIVLGLAGVVIGIWAHVLISPMKDQVETMAENADAVRGWAERIADHLTESEPASTGRHARAVPRPDAGERIARV